MFKSSPTPSRSSSTSASSKSDWKAKAKALGRKGFDKGVVVSDWAGKKANGVAEKVSNSPVWLSSRIVEAKSSKGETRGERVEDQAS